MCRLAAYLGPDTSLTHLIFDTDHSLEKQSWQPQELREAVLNADGFGLGWYNENTEIARYRQVMPIWNDVNLKDICNSIQRPLWLCYVRSATRGLGIGLQNTQPFCYQHWQYLHNGYINAFSDKIRGLIRQTLPQNLEAIIQGTTDSEYLFALILFYYQSSGDMLSAIRDCFTQLKNWLGNERALLNIIVTDGEQIIAARHAINGECPSLYFGNDIKGFPEQSQLLVSERPNDDAHWRSIEAHQLIHLRRGEPPEFQSI